MGSKGGVPKTRALRISAAIVARLIKEELDSTKKLDYLDDNLIFGTRRERTCVFLDLRNIMHNMLERSGLPDDVGKWPDLLNGKQE